MQKASVNSLKTWATLHCLRRGFPYPYSQIYSTRGLKSNQYWNQHLKYYSSYTFKWRHTQPDDFHLFARDRSTYTLRCIRCGQSVALPGSIGETVLHALTAMLYHRNMVESHDEENHRSFHLLLQLFTIIKIFSRRFELDGGSSNLLKTN